MRILIDGHMIGQHEGGNERYTKNLAIHLSKIVDTTVLMYKKTSMNAYGMKMVMFPHNDLFRLIFLPALMMKKGYTVLHSNYITPFWKAPKHRYVVMVHDLGFRRFPDIYGFKDTLIFRLLFPHSLRLADIIIVPSEFVKKEFMHFYPRFKDKVQVIYEGIDPVFLGKNQSKIKGEKHDAEPYLLCITSRSPRKNIPLVLDAFLKAQLPRVSLYIVGPKPGTEVSLSKKIKYLGYVSDIKLKRLYTHALALIYISSYEGFGLPPIEALACRTPVLASDIPSLHEICGKYVDYIRWGDSKALIRHMRKYSSSKGVVMGNSNLFIKKYDWNRTALSFYSILQKYYPCYNRGT